MICKDVKRLLRYEIKRSREATIEAQAHAETCTSCGQLLALETLTASLLSAPAAGAEFEPSPFWLSKVKNRIQEMKEHSLSSWEAAIMGLKGWIAAFGAAAIVLMAIGLQWQLSNASVDHEEELNAQASVEELISGDPESDVPVKSSEESRYDQ
jgi:hypothetical protein